MNRSRSSIARPPAGILLAALALAGTLASPGAGAEGSSRRVFRRQAAEQLSFP